MNLSGPFIARPIATSLLAVGIALAGLTAFKLLPVASLPKMDFPTIVVQAALPGASPEIMATAVATPLERQLGRIAGITEMTSSSSLGNTRIIVQFDLTRDIDGAARDVQAAINASLGQLPTNLPGNPTYRKVNPSEAPIVIMSLTSDSYSVGAMYDIASTILEQKLSQVDGIGQVQVGGSSLPAVRIELNPNTLNKYNISLEQVSQIISNANANMPKGQLTIGSRSSEIITNDQIFKPDDYSSLIISYNNGAAVRLSDVANVVESVEDVHNAGLSNNKPAIVMILSKEPGANVIETADNVKELLPLLKASIPAEIDLNVIMDRTTTIRASLLSVEITLLLAIVLVIAVVYLFLGSARAALIPSVAVPLSLAGTFGIMYLFGFSLDNLSLMALTIVTGFVVDDAVVVLENITRHIEAGIKPVQAALLGTKEVGFTVLSMSVSLIAVFIPILLMGGIVGRLFREFAVTLSIAILVSLVVSLTVTPMMCSLLLRKSVDSEDNKPKNKIIYHIKARYATSLAWALDHYNFILGLTVLTIFLSIFLYIIVPKGFFPQQDSGRITCSIQADQSMSFQEIKQKLIAYIKIASEDPAVENAAGYVSTSGAGGNSGNMFLTLKPLAERKISADAVIDRLRTKLSVVAGATLYMQSPQDIVVGGRQGNAQFQYTVSADSVQYLQEWTPKIMDELSKVSGIADINSDQRDHALQTFVQVDRDAAARLGVTTQQIDQALYNAFGQKQVSTLYTAMNQYHIVMTVAAKYWQDPEILNITYVPSASGEQIPLSSFAQFSTSTTSLTVNHQGQFPAVTLTFNLAAGAALGDVVANVNTMVGKMALPENIYGTFRGAAQAFQNSLSSEPYLILAALLAVYIVLGILYESCIHPITILSTLPSAGVGALLSLLITGTDLTVIALIGIILLIGIVKKNAIMMIDFAMHLKRSQNKSSREAIYEAAQLRFRPIMMTTMAALLGAVALVVSHDIGYELRRPLGITIIGGLVLSQMLTLYTTPVIYLSMEKYSQWTTRHWQAIRRGNEKIKAAC
jgi:multidrug efflux pump